MVDARRRIVDSHAGADQASALIDLPHRAVAAAHTVARR
jgi:hypothetical protein